MVGKKVQLLAEELFIFFFPEIWENEFHFNRVRNSCFVGICYSSNSLLETGSIEICFVLPENLTGQLKNAARKKWLLLTQLFIVINYFRFWKWVRKIGTFSFYFPKKLIVTRQLSAPTVDKIMSYLMKCRFIFILLFNMMSSVQVLLRNNPMKKSLNIRFSSHVVMQVSNGNIF